MSKAKDEADRLVEMYWDDFCPQNHFPNNNFCECNSLTQWQAIQCALIHVEGIIELLHHNDIYKEMLNWDNMDDYWQEVKQELNKML